MDRTDEGFPDVVAAIRRIPGEFLIDGEIVPWKDGIVLPFAHIQRRLGRKTLTPKMLRDDPAVFIAFDILYRNGELLMDRPLRERRENLLQLVGATLVSPDRATPQDAGAGDTSVAPTDVRLLVTAITPTSNARQIDDAFCAARDCRNEGLVLKDPESIYSPGRRGQMWLKLKTHLPTFDCVVTAAEYGHGKRHGVLSDYTFAVWDKDPTRHEDAQLVNIGKAYSGVTDAEIAQLTDIFLKLSRQQLGHVHIVEPKIVLEIACDQIQKSDRHASGYALRFPRIKRIRWDKKPGDAERLERIVEIYNSSANTAKSHQLEEPAPKHEPTLFD
jgi:DNA ligase-1